MLQLVRCEGVILSHELEVVGQIGRLRTLSLHVALGSFGLLFALERKRKLESSARHFDLAEIPELVFERLQVLDQLVSIHFVAAVV